jgi:hypothetical protein
MMDEAENSRMMIKPVSTFGFIIKPFGLSSESAIAV